MKRNKPTPKLKRGGPGLLGSMIASGQVKPEEDSNAADSILSAVSPRYNKTKALIGGIRLLTSKRKGGK